MVKLNFKALLADKEFRENRKIQYEEISQHTGISRQTLSRIATKRGYNLTLDTIERLCKYFGCKIEEFVMIIPDPPESGPPAARE